MHTELTTTGVASVTGSVYGSGGHGAAGFNPGGGGPGTSYGPLNFLYTTQI